MGFYGFCWQGFFVSGSVIGGERFFLFDDKTFFYVSDFFNIDLNFSRLYPMSPDLYLVVYPAQYFNIPVRTHFSQVPGFIYPFSLEERMGQENLPGSFRIVKIAPG